MIELNEDFWTSRYLNHQTGWDIGEVSTPIKEYIDQLQSTDMRVLIPGSGNAYEAEYLWEKGFRQVDVLDLSIEPLHHLKQRVIDWPENQLLHKDFFAHQGAYDLIIEQTFFCALNPSLRGAYVRKMKELLKPQGKLVGLLFNIPLNADQPPFGGDQSTYLSLFEKEFTMLKMETAFNSVPPRAGNELWIALTPR